MLPEYPTTQSQGRLVREYNGLSLIKVHLHSIGQVFVSDGYDLGTENLGLQQGLALAPQRLEKARVGMDTDRFSVLSMRNGNMSTKCGGHKGVEARQILFQRLQ